MKNLKFAILFAVLFNLLTFNSKANNLNNISYDNFIITNSDTIFCENLAVNDQSLNITNEKGKLSSLSYDDIIMYKKDGRLFKKNVAIVNGKVDYLRKPIFMELIAHKNNMDLMQVVRYESSSNDLKLDYYIFENNNFKLQLDDKNIDFLFKFFKE